MRFAPLLAAAAALALPATSSAAPQLFEAVNIGSVADRPTGIAFAPGVSSQMYVAAKKGRIWIFRNGSMVGTPFLDIRDRVDQEGENGLLGFAFDPDFQTNGSFYVSYTMANTPFGDSVVSRFQVVPGSIDVADPASETILWGPFPQQSFGHKSGDLEMGIDGTIYVAIGDGDGGVAPGPSTAQDLSDPRGSILRIDPNVPHPHVPADNPYVTTPGAHPHIWASGFRNPFRIDVDPATGDVYVADVGASRWEEVTRLPFGVAGMNGGWPCMSGSECLADPSCVCPSPSLTAPVMAKGHGAPDGYCAIIGGVVYRGDDIPELAGQYLYTDFCSGKFNGVADPSGTPTDVDHTAALSNPVTGAPIAFVGDFGRDHEGEVYFAEHYSARLWKIVPKAGIEPYCDSNPNSSGAVATLAITGSTSLAAADLTLDVTDLPATTFGFFLMSQGRTVFPNFFGSDGVLCVAPTIHRWNDVIFDSGPDGSVSRTTDLTDLPFGVTFAAGETWHFQYWTRDSNPGPTSNTSSAVAVTFEP